MIQFFPHYLGPSSNPSSPTKKCDPSQLSEDATQDASSTSMRPLSTPVPPLIVPDKAVPSSSSSSPSSSKMTALPSVMHSPIASSSLSCYSTSVTPPHANSGPSSLSKGDDNHLETSKKTHLGNYLQKDQLPANHEIVSDAFSPKHSPSR